MALSKYMQGFVDQSCLEAEKEGPLCGFFREFCEKMKERVNRPKNSPGDRYTVPSVMKDSLKHLLPSGLEIRSEVSLKDFVSNVDEELGKLVNSKRVDFVVTGNGKKLLIEFKTCIDFNALAAAMLEIKLVKMFCRPDLKENIRTGVLHLYPNTQNIPGLQTMNKKFDSPLDNIWILGKSNNGSPVFDIEAIKGFRNDIEKWFGTV